MEWGIKLLLLEVFVGDKKWDFVVSAKNQTRFEFSWFKNKSKNLEFEILYDKISNFKVQIKIFSLITSQNLLWRL